MSSLPISSFGQEHKLPSFLLENMSTATQQLYVLRLNGTPTLPPPQNQSVGLANGASSAHIYSHSHPISYLGSAANKSQFQRYGFLGTDLFNYPTLGQSQARASVQRMLQLPQVGSQNLPQTVLSTTPTSLLGLDKIPQGQFQPYVAQTHQLQHLQHLQGPFSAQDLDLKGLLPLGIPSNPITSGTPILQLYAKQMRYLPSDGISLRLDEDGTNSHTPKFINSKHTRSSSKDLKFSSLKFSSSVSTDPDSLKPFICTHEGCTWSFVRQSDLRRHSKSHNAPTFHCPYWKNDPTCHRNGGSFSRLDVLKRHLRLVHYIKDKQKTFPGTDPGWCRSCQKMFLTSKNFIIHCEDCSSQVAPAEWKSSALKEPMNAISE